ncbi:MAG: GNAT family N-acetyltransferase [candidate division NC10 bacterium]|nr:GNAT family N-acetyltransferase [candidate division NC10 bacterium]
MELVLTRCTIRSWRPEDTAALVRYANNRGVWRNLRDRFPHPYTVRDAETWIRHASGAVPETHFAIVVGEEAVGAIGLELQTDVFRRSAEIGFWLAEPFWGRGITTEAVRAMTDFAFATFDLCRVFAGVFEWNPASMRVLEKAGYTREGRLRKSVTKDGQTMDQMLYAVVREEAPLGGAVGA